MTLTSRIKIEKLGPKMTAFINSTKALKPNFQFQRSVNAYHLFKEV